MSTSSEQLALTYQEKTDIEHILDAPDTYIGSIESDEVNDDAVDNSLITLVGSLSTQVTAFTDRIAQAEAAIADYEGRITTLES